MGRIRLWLARQDRQSLTTQVNRPTDQAANQPASKQKVRCPQVHPTPLRYVCLSVWLAGCLSGWQSVAGGGGGGGGGGKRKRRKGRKTRKGHKGTERETRAASSEQQGNTCNRQGRGSREKESLESARVCRERIETSPESLENRSPATNVNIGLSCLGLSHSIIHTIYIHTYIHTSHTLYHSSVIDRVNKQARWRRESESERESEGRGRERERERESGWGAEEESSVWVGGRRSRRGERGGEGRGATHSKRSKQVGGMLPVINFKPTKQQQYCMAWYGRIIDRELSRHHPHS